MIEKVVIITGASSGIGKACALRFADKNTAIVIAARNKNNLEAAAKELADITPHVLSVACDVAKKNDCERLIEQTIAQFQRIDVLINNAGISMRALFNEMDVEVLEKVMNINFYGTVYCTKFALPYLLASKGTIVGVSSIAGFVGLPARTGYSASKFAMQGFLEALRTENFKTGLKVLVACPGFTASNIRNTALAADGNAQKESPRDENKMMTSEEVADEIYKAVQRKKQLLVLTFEGKMAVFLSKFFPKFISKMVYNKMAKEPNSPIK
ncbi:MAG TPA: SDR family oxidoreductase [Vicingaceae bacterium]|jgi:short-subunit dehydrogenase|nr:SDR family oxidoreductase [Vicingaceae bacterium]